MCDVWDQIESITDNAVHGRPENVIALQLNWTDKLTNEIETFEIAFKVDAGTNSSYLCTLCADVVQRAVTVRLAGEDEISTFCMRCQDEVELGPNNEPPLNYLKNYLKLMLGLQDVDF